MIKPLAKANTHLFSFALLVFPPTFSDFPPPSGDEIKKQTILKSWGVRENLPRRANIAGGLGYLGRDKGVLVGQNFLPTSDLLQQGLQKGDTILLFNGKKVENDIAWDNLLASFREGDQYDLTIKRGEKTLRQPITFSALPKENWPGHESEYTHVTVAGKKARVILTYPLSAGVSSNAKAHGPTASAKLDRTAIFILSGLSCSSIELSGLPRKSGWGLLLEDLVTRSGMITMRVEKFGVGDSEGSCSGTDFNTEMELYRTALRALFENKKVDRVVIFGSSMGSMQAAILANEFPVKAVVASGTFIKSWYEHMLEIERRIMEMNGVSFATIQDRSMKYAELYYDAMVKGKTFKEIVAEKSYLKEVNTQGDAHLYGRPLSYYQQLQKINIPSYWEKIKVPVLLHYGTNDWIMTEEDNEILVRLLKKSNANVSYLPSEGMDHNYFIFPDREAAFKNYWSGKPAADLSTKIIEWIRNTPQS
jgi:pimeloyl-ACP methyl ester carboxylesterase